jgi:hypothetical protein
MIKIISATRLSASQFKRCPLGISLQRLAFDKRVSAWIAYDNRLALPMVYNRHIVEGNRENIIVFMHDDIWIDDYFFADRLIDGLSKFDVVGLAGNKAPSPEAPAWNYVSEALEWDYEHLSGAVAHGAQPFGNVYYFGPTGVEVKTVDGLLIAAKGAVLLDKKITFDEQFDFHFYDMDFCKTCVQNGARIGTYPIAVTHVSLGGLGSDSWKAGLKKFREKWKKIAI